MSDRPTVPQSGPHPTDDTLELYSMGRLDEGQEANVEEHLLLCTRCQERVVESDRYVNTMRSALTRTEPTAVRKPLFDLRWAAGLAVAALATVAIVPSLRRDSGEPQEISLEALRGGEAAQAVAQAGRPLVLRLDAAGIDTSDLQVNVVSSSGSPVWKGNPTAADGRATVAIGKSLAAGQYWVRFVNSSDKTLREFSLQVK